ncbi:MAG: GerW family sporulation protein [Lachnospiraceae bacterium]
MAEKDFASTTQALFKGMNEFITSKTVVGEPVHTGDTIILPLMDVTFGVGAGTGSDTAKSGRSVGGMGGKMTPSSVLIISDGSTRLVNIKGQDSLGKILDMLPDVVNRFASGRGAEKKADAGEKKPDEGERTPEA